jgi:hypothetical protein
MTLKNQTCIYQNDLGVCTAQDSTSYGKECPSLTHPDEISVFDCIQSIPIHLMR